MQQNNITQRVIAIIIETLGVDADEVKPESNIKDDLGADSLDKMGLIMELEKEFCITIPDEATESLVTVQQAITLVEERCGGKA